MIYSSEKLFSLGIIHGTTSRREGNMRDLPSQERLFSTLGLQKENFLRLKQVHTDNIIAVHTDEDFENYKNVFASADAWLLTRPRTGIIILTADCLPVFMWSEDGKVLGLAHAGWRGVRAEIVLKLALEMQKLTTQSLHVLAGPHIQSCCFEVKEDVAQFFPSSVENRDGKMYVDLNKEIKAQLLRAGLKEENISLPCQCACTCCNEKEYFSYRRTGEKDAEMSFIYKP